jgi:hypothetical protein
MSEPFVREIQLPFGLGRVKRWVAGVIAFGFAAGLCGGIVLFWGGPSDSDQPGGGGQPTCGDGIVNQPDESCDGNDLGECAEGLSCTDDCLCGSIVKVPVCGDGIVDQGESCDGNDLGECAEGLICTKDCLCGSEVIKCGNNQVDSGEQCDPPGEVCTLASGMTTVYCALDCTCVHETELCGNGQLEPHEQCDVSAGVFCGPTEGCDSGHCQCYEIPVEPGEPPEASPPQGDVCAAPGTTVETFEVFNCLYDSADGLWHYCEGMRCTDAAGVVVFDGCVSEYVTSPVWMPFCDNPFGNGDGDGDGGDGGPPSCRDEPHNPDCVP